MADFNIERYWREEGVEYCSPKWGREYAEAKYREARGALSPDTQRHFAAWVTMIKLSNFQNYTSED